MVTAAALTSAATAAADQSAETLLLLLLLLLGVKKQSVGAQSEVRTGHQKLQALSWRAQIPRL
jgi:hypothetical protein